MKGINKVTLVGNIGGELELYKGQGFESTKFSLAIDESYKDKSGQKIEKTEWINIVAFNKVSDIINRICQKGSTIYLEGKMSTKKFDHNGITKYKTEVIVNVVQLIKGGKNV